MDLNKELMELKKKATPLNAFKFVTGTVISLGVYAAVISFMQNPIKNAKGLTKLMMKLGIFVLGCKAADVAEEYFDDTVDDIVKTFKEAKEEMAQ